MGIYSQIGTFDLPAAGYVFDALPDGRLITTDGSTVKVETRPKSRQFSDLAKVNFGPSNFLKVSLDGSLAATGFWSKDQKAVFTFNTADAKGVKSFPADNFDAEWLTASHLALTAEPPTPRERAIVTALDVNTGQLKTIVRNAGDASGGVTILEPLGIGLLFIGDGYSDESADVTGQVKAFTKAAWTSALSSGDAMDFDSSGTLIATILSAATLGFDKYGNLHIGGGDMGGTEKGYAAVIAKGAILKVLAGGPPVTPKSPASVLQRLDPSPADNFWLVYSNRITGELYLNDAGKQEVYVFELEKR